MKFDIILMNPPYANKLHEKILIKCLDIWDEMFSKQIGLIRKLSKDISEI